jgi:REP element-mobilizing transposase RayT
VRLRGYTLREIAAATGLNCSTISRRIAAHEGHAQPANLVAAQDLTQGLGTAVSDTAGCQALSVSSLQHVRFGAGPFARRPYRHGMGRRPREFSEGIYHLGSHGSDLRHLFLADGDRLTFLERLALIVARFELALAAYTLMGNHYHLLVATPDARLSEAIQQLHGWYSRRHNKTHSRSASVSGPLFAREVRADGVSGLALQHGIRVRPSLAKSHVLRGGVCG